MHKLHLHGITVLAKACAFFVFILFLNNCTPKKNSCTKIPTLDIVKISINSDKKTSFQIYYSDCDKKDTLDVKGKYRGGFSSRFEKHSYSLEFNEKQSFHQQLKSKNWVLNSSYIDRSFMRHKLSFDLFRQMSKSNISPHCEYVWVKENGKNLGLYVLMERMDRIRLKAQKSQEGAFICKSPPLFYDTIPTEKRDSLYFDSMEFPKKKKKKKKALKHSKLVVLEKLIYEASDSKFKKNIFKLIDEQSFIDWQLIILFSNSGDAQLKNYCIYQKSDKDKLRIALWDYDHTFGRDGNSEPNLATRNVDEKRNPLMKRLIELNPNNFNKKLAIRYGEMRKKVFTRKNVFRLISANHTIIEPYIAENQKYWPTDSKWYFDSKNYKQDIQLIKLFVSIRLKQLDKRFNFKNP